MHRQKLPPKAATPQRNVINKQVKNRVNHFSAVKPLAPVFRKLLLVLIGLAFVAFFAYRIYLIVLESYKPNARIFSECSNAFTQIGTKPTYGIIFDIHNDEVRSIKLTAPVGSSGEKSIMIDQHDWLVVYFSNNFTFTPVSEFLRLSKLEKGEIDYCYLIDQLSLTSGVPVEYVIVSDNISGLSSSVTLAQTNQILDETAKGTVLTFNTKLLPLYALADGSEASVVTYSAFREQFPNFFRIEEIAQEQAFVEVYNATTISGYASVIAKKWAMLGIEVSRVNNVAYTETTDAVAVVYLKDATMYKRTLAIIKSSLPKGKIEIKQGRPPNLVTTGDIVVFLLKR
jgi:hypothetical protein